MSDSRIERICYDCALYISNGEVPEDTTEWHKEIADDTLGKFIISVLFNDDGAPEFSTADCFCCDETKAGDRYEAEVLDR